MTAEELKKKYFGFFEKRGHKKLPNVSLVPEDVSSSALFISAGMHPLIPYLIGEHHPLGKKLVSNQRCIRTGDIEEVGDPLHLTFFEMLGNWSLGDPASPDGIGQGGYWKEEAISWSYEFLTKELGIPQEKISVSCFAGDRDAPKDEKSARIWKKLGIPKERIYFFGKKENWWGPVEETGPCGPDTEMFIDTGRKSCGPKCDPSCQCGKYFEVWNDVFMQYDKKIKNQKSKIKINNLEEKDFEYLPLKQRNVDTGMGVERVLAVMQDKDDIFLIDEIRPIIQKIEKVSGKKYEGEKKKLMRVIADHLRAAAFIIGDGVEPSNVEHGYVVRRLIRRAVWSGRELDIIGSFLSNIATSVVDIHKEAYPDLAKNKDRIYTQLSLEEQTYLRDVLSEKSLERAKNEQLALKEKFPNLDDRLRGSASEAFNSLATYGIPPEISMDYAKQFGTVSAETESEWWDEFIKQKEKHREVSRVGMGKKFAGGLADHSEEVTKLHTATHLLQAALRRVLGKEVFQKGSNITAERLRFDFSSPRRLTEKELKDTEDLVNQIIKKNLPVEMETMSFAEAKKKGAIAVFGQKYGEEVKTYRVGPKTKPFSFEVCGGPHVDFTGKLGKFKIIRQEAVGSGARRLYARLEQRT